MIYYVQNDGVLWNKFLLGNIKYIPNRTWIANKYSTFTLDDFTTLVWLLCYQPCSEKEIEEGVLSHPLFSGHDKDYIKSCLRKTIKYLCREHLIITQQNREFGRNADLNKYKKLYKVSAKNDDPSSPHLFSISWNWTNLCNMKCRHCYSRTERYEQELTTEESLAVAQQMSEMGVLEVIFGGGECLLRPDLYQVLAVLYDNNVSCQLSSNGLTFSETIARKLVDAGLDRINFSLDSHKPEIHDWLRNKKGSFKKVVEAIKTAKKHGLRVNILSMLFNQNIHLTDEMIDLAVSQGVESITFKPVKISGKAAVGSTIRASQQDYESAIIKLSQNAVKFRDDIYIDYGQTNEPFVRSVIKRYSLPQQKNKDGFPSTKGCFCGEITMCIKPNGDVTPCVYMSLSVGNVRADHLYEIWKNGKNMNLLRREKQKLENQLESRNEDADICLTQIIANNADLKKELERLSNRSS